MVRSKVAVTWPRRVAGGKEINDVSTGLSRVCMSSWDGVTAVLGAGSLCFTSILSILTGLLPSL